MTRIAYFDCFSGVAGDMILGALVDAGLPLETLSKGLEALDLGGYRLHASRTSRSGVKGTKVDVVIDAPGAPFRSPDSLKDLIEKSRLPAAVKRDSIAAVMKLKAAEAAVHGIDAGHVMFHEIGAIDTAVDVAGAVLGLHLLGVEEVHSSPVYVGGGSVQTEHGLMPGHPPASAEILKGIPTRAAGVDGEIATPTGCALLAALCRSFGPQPAMTADSIGYGAGDRVFEGRPNLLRVTLGESGGGAASDGLVLLETNLDNVTGEVTGQAFERLFAAGALDVWACPALMKKNRPAQILSALAPEGKAFDVERAMFLETGTLGIRKRGVQRTVLERRHVKAATPFGEVRIKTGAVPGGGEIASPEFEDCLALAKAAGVPVREVIAAAAAAHFAARKSMS